jgi:hypothetical protein
MTTSAEDFAAIEGEQDEEQQPLDARAHAGDGDTAAAEAGATERPIHEARCRECGGGVAYYLTESGNGIIVRDTRGYGMDQSFGISGNSIPICPIDGHGEMELSDEQLPAEEAFALAQEKLAAAAGHAQQPSLPGVVMPFNFQGAYLELEEKAVEVDRLHAEYKAAAEEAKDAKKAWDKAAELYTRMALELRRRRKAKEGEPASDLLDASEREQTNLVACLFEQRNQGQACPICRSDDLKPEAARDSEAHLEEVAEVLDVRSATEVSDALEFIDILVPILTIRGWDQEQRAAVLEWATHGDSSQPRPERPKVLGTGHVASKPVDGEPQACTQCDAVLTAVPEDGSDPNYYGEGLIVGVDCAGRAKTDGQRYPKRGRRKKAETTEATE